MLVPAAALAAAAGADALRRTTALHHAARWEGLREGSGALEALRTIAGVGSAERSRSGATPLHVAASSGSIDAVRALLSAGIDPLAADRDGDLARHLAVLRGHTAIAAELRAAEAAAGAPAAARRG
eukprot:gene17896-12345_t